MQQGGFFFSVICYVSDKCRRCLKSELVFGQVAIPVVCAIATSSRVDSRGREFFILFLFFGGIRTLVKREGDTQERS